MRENTHIVHAADARKAVESALQKIITAPENEYLQRNQPAFLDKMLYLMNCSITFEDTLRAGKEQADKDKKGTWDNDIIKARDLRNRNQNNPAEDAMHLMLLRLCNEYSARNESLKLDKSWLRWESGDVVKAINFAKLKKTGANTDAPFIALQFAEKLASANKPAEIAKPDLLVPVYQ